MLSAKEGDLPYAHKESPGLSNRLQCRSSISREELQLGVEFHVQPGAVVHKTAEILYRTGPSTMSG